MPDRPTLLLTRPARQAQAFLAALSAELGREPAHHISPVLQIAPVAFEDPGAPQALLFTSANGVSAFTSQHAAADRMAYCVGDSTAEAARAAGFVARSAAGDVDKLVERIIADLDPAAGPLVHISGDHVAGDLVEVLRNAGFDARRRVAYTQQPQSLDATARDLLRSGPVVAPLFSPRSAMIFAEQVAAIHPVDLTTIAISQDAAVEGVGLTLIAPEPSRKGMIAALRPHL